MINEEHYYDANNKVLTQSKLKDYMKCPNYFYRKHILGEVENVSTPAMKTGSVVDEILTEDQIDKKYAIGKLNTKEGKALKEEGYEVISQLRYDEIWGLSLAVSETTAYKDMKKFQGQTIICVAEDVGPHFQFLGGKLDFKFQIVKRGGIIICTLRDLKTAQTVNKRKYFYHAKDLGYFFQAAYYQKIMLAIHPEIDEFVFQHIVVGKIKDIYPVKCYTLPQRLIEQEYDEIDRLIYEIANETEFPKADATWEGAEELDIQDKFE